MACVYKDGVIYMDWEWTELGIISYIWKPRVLGYCYNPLGKQHMASSYKIYDV